MIVVEPHVYYKLVKKLSQKYNVVLMCEGEFAKEAEAEDTYSEKPQIPDIRAWAAIIEASDYFIGCDSLGQHLARAFDVPGTVILGSTFAENISYPDWFQIIDDRKTQKRYSPIRICGFDNHLSDRINDRLMDFNDEEITDIYTRIVKDIKEKV